ncbi:hypothetical protein Hdeb2414_s0001g00014531 [Helianthus debilis subsp. tardiflorus]
MLIIHVPIIQNFTQHSPYFILSYGSHRTHKTHLLIFIKHPKFIKSSHPKIIHTWVKHGALLGAFWSLNIFLFSCLDCAIFWTPNELVGSLWMKHVKRSKYGKKSVAWMQGK